MKYLNSSFSISPPDKQDGLSCPRCALGPKWGEHAEDCPRADWVAVYLPMRVGDKPDPTRSGFESEEAAWEYVYAGMCPDCREERARVLAGNGQEFDSDWPACAAEWMVLPTGAYESADLLTEMAEAAGWKRIYPR